MTAELAHTPGLSLVVCGGGQHADRAAVFAALDRVHAKRGIRFVIQGNGAGAAYLASQWADEHGVPCRSYPVNWDEHGRNAQEIRNQEIIDKGKPEGVISFSGGPGSADLVHRAEKAGIIVWRPRV